MLEKITRFAKGFDEASQKIGKALYHSGKGLTRIGLVGGTGYALYKGYSAVSQPLDLKSVPIFFGSNDSLTGLFFKLIGNTQKQLLNTPADHCMDLLKTSLEEIHTILDETNQDISTELKTAHDRSLRKLKSSVEKIIRKLEMAPPGNSEITLETSIILHDTLEEVEELLDKAFRECDQKLAKTETKTDKFFKQKAEIMHRLLASSQTSKEDMVEEIKMAKESLETDLEKAQKKLDQAKETIRQKIEESKEKAKLKVKNAQTEFRQKSSYCPTIDIPLVGKVYKTSLFGTGSGALHLALWTFCAHPIALGISGACTVIPLLWSRTQALEDAEKKSKAGE